MKTRHLVLAIGIPALAASVGCLPAATAATGPGPLIQSVTVAPDPVVLVPTKDGTVTVTMKVKGRSGAVRAVGGSIRPQGAATAYQKIDAFTAVPGVADTYRAVFTVARAAKPGGWQVDAVASSASGAVTTQVDAAAFSVKRKTRIVRFDASPEPVTAGGALRMHGRLLRMTPTGYVGFGGRHVAVQFQAAGATTWQTIKTTTTAADGRFRARATAASTGTWRTVFLGGPLYTAASSRRDAVAVG